jgi:hypothetical protein
MPVTRIVLLPKNPTFNDLYQLLPHEWADFETLSSAQTHDLKFDDGKYRVWVSRMTLRDYDGNAEAYGNERLQFERYDHGTWIPLDRYGKPFGTRRVTAF